MYEYKSVKHKGIRKTNEVNFDGQMEIITAQAREGWRFVAAIPSLIKGYGQIDTLELVFEKEK